MRAFFKDKIGEKVWFEILKYLKQVQEMCNDLEKAKCTTWGCSNFCLNADREY